MKKSVPLLFIVILLIHAGVDAQSLNISQKSKDIDVIVTKILKDWNVAGCGVGIVIKNKLVFAKGYGYRDLEKKLPVTPNTLFQIASNTKLFTATAAGFLVEEGKLDWDKPVKNFVPEIQFYNDDLNANVTIRDMLSHRTGISRHDNIWYKSDFTREQLFERLKYLEPSIPLRQGYLYNNLMYAASGQVIERLSGQKYEEFIATRIFKPLNMSRTGFTVEEMKKQSDYMAPYYEKRDTTVLLPYPFYTQNYGLSAAGAIVSSINDLAHWVSAQMNGGKFESKQVIPLSIIRETMKPAALSAGVPEKYFENLNSMYGMGRSTSSYKGHYRTQHSGVIGGIYSMISILPSDSIGMIVFVNGGSTNLPSYITNHLYDKLLNLTETPWSDRALKDWTRDKITEREMRKHPDVDRVANTKPSHPLSDYAGKYQDAAYGVMEIYEQNNELSFMFNNTKLPLRHYHYERFVSPDDEIDGKWSIIFTTDAQGSIQNLKVSLDEKEVVFNKKADGLLTDPAFLKSLTGAYELNGNTLNVVVSNKELTFATAPPQHLEPYKGKTFRIREFSDQVVEFITGSDGQPNGLKLTFDGKAVMFTKKL